MADGRPFFRSLLTLLMGFSLFWFYAQANGGANVGHFQILFVGVALVVFFYLHHRVINSVGFFTEFSDLTSRGATQNVLVFGDWFEKQRDLRIARDNNPIAAPPWISGAAIFYWVIVGYMFTSLTAHFSISFFAMAVLAAWAWASPRALMWVPIAAVTLFLSLWVSQTQVARIGSCLFFLVFLSTYAACFSHFAAREPYFKIKSWVMANWPPLLIFLIAFLLATFFFPDQKSLFRMAQFKAEMAQQLAKDSTPQKPGQNAPPKQNDEQAGPQQGDGAGGPGDGKEQQSASQDPNGKDGADGSGSQNQNGAGGGPSPKSAGGKSGAGSTGQQGATGGQGSQGQQQSAQNAQPKQGSQGNQGQQSGQGSQGQPGAQNGPQAKGGGANGEGNNDQNGGGSGNGPQDKKGNQGKGESKSEKPKPTPELTEEKIRSIIEKVEIVLKIVLAIMIASMIFRYLTRKGKPKASSSKKMDRKRLKNVMREIAGLVDHEYPTQREEIIATYHAFLKAMEAVGIKKLDWQTPEQFSIESSKKTQLREVPKVLSDAFASAYYGKHDLNKDELLRFRAEAKKIKNIVF